MLVQSAVFTPGMYSLVHHHSGVEAVYVIDGEACYETPTRAAKLQKGETLALPGGTQMRAMVTGSNRTWGRDQRGMIDPCRGGGLPRQRPIRRNLRGGDKTRPTTPLTSPAEAAAASRRSQR